MTVDTYLSQYKTLQKRIERRSARMAIMKMRMDSIVAAWGEHISAHTHEAPYVRLVEKMETLQEEQLEDKSLMSSLEDQILDLIYSLPDDTMVQVLRCRSLEGLNYQQIADLIDVDRSTAKRWQTRALALLNVPENALVIENCEYATNCNMLQQNATNYNKKQQLA